jgi:hypothetical protein
LLVTFKVLSGDGDSDISIVLGLEVTTQILLHRTTKAGAEGISVKLEVGKPLRPKMAVQELLKMAIELGLPLSPVSVLMEPHFHLLLSIQQLQETFKTFGLKIFN